MKLRWLTAALVVGGQALAREVTFHEALAMALKAHPAIEAEKQRTTAREEEIRRARANYFPRVNAMALWTNGFPGSAGATGVGGLMVSPYHKGPSAGVLVEQELYDFGRTSGNVTVAKKETEVAKEDEKVVAADVGTQVTRVYYACVRDRNLAGLYERLSTDAKRIETEVENYVRSGQRSVVEKYLSKSQTEETRTQQAAYAKKWQRDRESLALLVGTPGVDDCAADLAPAAAPEAKASPAPTESPLVAKAAKEVSLAEAQVDRTKADYLPRVVGVGSLGYMQNTELGFPKKNYAVAVGVIFPLFEGFRTDAELARNRAVVMERQKDLEASKIAVAATTLALDREADAETVRLEHLKEETKIAEEAFELAKKRYFRQQGTLVDLREALRNYARTWSEQYSAQANRAEKLAEKSLLNGALVQESGAR